MWAAKPLPSDVGGAAVSALAPLPIGLAVMVAHLTLGPFTGSGINPTRVLGAVAFESDAWWEPHRPATVTLLFPPATDTHPLPLPLTPAPTLTRWEQPGPALWIWVAGARRPTHHRPSGPPCHLAHPR